MTKREEAALLQALLRSYINIYSLININDESCRPEIPPGLCIGSNVDNKISLVDYHAVFSTIDRQKRSK